MVIKVDCCRCGRELEKKGAILWGPPDARERCKKDHLCRECYGEVKKMMRKVTPT